MGIPAVFLDRDGTINVRARPHEYIADVTDFEWKRNAAEGMTAMARAGLPLIVVSNQRGVARGLVTVPTLRAIEAVIQDRLAREGCGVTSFRYCPHDVDAACRCRKPQPGMILDAARDLDLDLERSWMIGDTDTDIAAGRAAGTRTIRIGGAPDVSEPTATDLLEAARLVVGSEPPAPGGTLAAQGHPNDSMGD